MIQLDLPLKSQVFLTNRQQDLQMLNSTKLSFFLDTLLDGQHLAILAACVEQGEGRTGNIWQYLLLV